ncbi:MAG TPA: thermosome subunit beta [Candidatus Thermoplasmatota archaeon]|jgi:thermosome|nr:thermosome subunit beta [Candidatus Thermoplasmatota archaeon]
MAMGGNTPIIILKEGTQREKGKGAQANNIQAARAISDAVKSALGPRGMDKMLVDSLGDVVVTNDGATILKEVDIQHPAAKMLAEVAKTMDDEIGDGTTTAVVLAGELLGEAEKLLDDVHPTILAAGFKTAANEAVARLDKLAIKVSFDDTKTLMKVAQTSMTSKAPPGLREQLADIAVKAVRAVADAVEGGKGYSVDIDQILVVKKKGASLEETQMIQGLIIDKERVHQGMPKRVEGAKIALLNAALEVRKTEVSSKIKITGSTQLQGFLDEEEGMIRKMTQQVKASGANVVFCQKGVDDLAQHFLAKEGIYCVRRVKKSDLEKLERATGGKIVNAIDALTKDDLGKAQLVEEQRVGGDFLTFVTGCKNPRSVSVLIRGGSEQVVDEAERALEDALCAVGIAVEDGRVVPGGGAPETELALHLRKFSSKLQGREQFAVEAFARGLESVPRALAHNAGLEAIDVLVQMRSAHEQGQTAAGIDVLKGKPVDMEKLGVLEPLLVKRQAILSAAEAAAMILRIDDVIAAKSYQEDKGAPGGDAHGH